MPAAPLPENESTRAEFIATRSLVQLPRQREFDRLVCTVSQVFRSPIALLTLVDGSHQWFKARVGLILPGTPRDVAFCGYTILSDDVLVVGDATLDDRFRDNRLVTGDPGIRFYAGAPLLAPDGVRLGSLCAIDRQPRTTTPMQLLQLQLLARSATSLLLNARAGQD